MIFEIEKAYDKETAIDAISGVLFWDAFTSWLENNEEKLEIVYNEGKDNFTVGKEFFLNIDDKDFKKAFLITLKILQSYKEKNKKCKKFIKHIEENIKDIKYKL